MKSAAMERTFGIFICSENESLFHTSELTPQPCHLGSQNSGKAKLYSFLFSVWRMIPEQIEATYLNLLALLCCLRDACVHYRGIRNVICMRIVFRVPFIYNHTCTCKRVTKAVNKCWVYFVNIMSAHVWVCVCSQQLSVPATSPGVWPAEGVDHVAVLLHDALRGLRHDVPFNPRTVRHQTLHHL